MDDESLARVLHALGNPVRLRILQQLRTPRSVGELRVSPRRVEAGGNPERPSAKPTVLAHIETLIAAGLVHAIGPARHRRYVADGPVLHAAVQALEGWTRRPSQTVTTCQPDSPID